MGSVGKETYVTLGEVAKEANVSAATVSRFLNKTAHVSEDTARRITRAIERLGYIPNQKAQDLARGHSNLIGLLLRDPRNPYYGFLHAFLQEECIDNDLKLISAIPGTMQGSRAEYSGIETLLGLRVGGLLIATGVLSEDTIVDISKHIPTVLVGRPRFNSAIATVSYDESKNIRALVEFALRQGHRKVAVIYRDKEFSFIESLRGELFSKELLRNGVSIIPVKIESFESLQEANIEVLRLVAERKITLAMFSNDAQALSFMKFALENGLHIPEDVSVTGYDATHDSVFVAGLTSLKLPLKEAAKHSVRMLREMMEGQQTTPDQIVLEGELLKGRTVKPLL
ncbi:LacI family DNA-binding transcriptional regulator (plasmid) [Deinococcus sp. VB343]|uniref:LacI family DNA-binding transcriptional regulator n=1 Tax=Deinococcus sp. VB142 TaxID=3112952 RepID=A0AAU6Q939_9DEIO